MVDEAKYKKLVAKLDDLIDQVGEDETHALASKMDRLSVLVENYEKTNIPELEFEGNIACQPF